MTEIKNLKYGDRFYYGKLQYIKVNEKTFCKEKLDGFCVAANLSNGNIAIFKEYTEVKLPNKSLEEA